MFDSSLTLADPWTPWHGALNFAAFTDPVLVTLRVTIPYWSRSAW